MSPSQTPGKALTTQASKSMQAELQREKDRLKLLLDMTNTQVSNLECRDLLRAISASIQRVMQCDSVSVWLPDTKQGQLRAHALEFPESKGFVKEDLFLPVEGSLIGSVFKTGKPLVVGGKTDFMSEQVTPEALAEGLESGCALPLISRNRTLGVLTLANRAENSFSPEDIDFLVRVAGQVAIAIENASLYSDLQRSEAFLAQGQSISHTGSFGWNVSSGEIYWSEETYKIFEYDRAVKPTLELVLQRIHPDDRDLVQQTIDRASEARANLDFDHRLLMPDGSVKYLHVIARALETSSGKREYMGAVRDVTERTRAEEALRQAKADLAHINRVTTMGELTASMAHEVNQPIAAAVTDANTCMRWLTRDHPDLGEARAAAMRVVKDATRASEIISRIRLLFNKGTPERELVDVNEIIGEKIVLLRSEAIRYNISVRTELAADLPQVMGDRVQLQQVLMNLMSNGIDAVKDVDGARELAIKSQRAEDEQLLVSVSDTGVGLPPQQADQIFNAFFTTKPHGT